MIKQKAIFLSGEADAWFERNHSAMERRQFDRSDPVVSAIGRCISSSEKGGRLLEIGCGEGKRLQWISQNLGIECHGIEPSSKAVAVACNRGVHAVKGTADKLPFRDCEFDFLVFGFCLYLCDRDDLFQIASEAHRVLKPNAWLIIQDFFSYTPYSKDYHHRKGVMSYKMDYRSLFSWHPSYECFSHELTHHGSSSFTDDANEWVGLSILRKKTAP